MVLIAARSFSSAAQLGVFRGDTGGKRRRRSFFPVPARNTIENQRGCDAVKRLLATLSPSEPVQQADAWIVVDVLRATTTMVAFFDAGGEALFPVGDVPDAFRLRVLDSTMSWNNGVFDGAGNRIDAQPTDTLSVGRLMQVLCGYLPFQQAFLEEICYCADEY